MTRGRKVEIAVAATAIVLLLLWLLIPVPFVRGLIIGVVLTLLLIVGGGVLVSKRIKKRFGSQLRPPPLPMKSWDYSMELSDLSGSPVDSSTFSGRVFVLNFWATWCAPCVAELPSLKRLHDQTSDLDLGFALVTRESPDVVKKFVDARGLELPIYLLAGDPPECFQSRAIPATFILDKTGTITMRHFGAAKWDDTSVVSFIRGLASTPP